MQGLERAVRLAVDAHRGQTYPSPEREPYVFHPLRVMLAVSGDEAQIAGVLHDVIEDSSVTLAQLAQEGFPPAVVHTLDCLTHREDESYDAYIERVASDTTAIEVKLADIDDNLRNNGRLARTPEVIERMARYQRARTFLRARRRDAGQMVLARSDILAVSD